jgi:hypothetical protein
VKCWSSSEKDVQVAAMRKKILITKFVYRQKGLKSVLGIQIQVRWNPDQVMLDPDLFWEDQDSSELFQFAVQCFILTVKLELDVQQIRWIGEP